MKIASIEDEDVYAEVIINAMGTLGHACHRFKTGGEFIRALRDQVFDLVLLDMRLPDMQGDEILRWIRNTVGLQLPVIVLTAYNGEHDLVSTLSAGADDYVTKPIVVPELVARIQAVLRRVYGLADPSDDLVRQGLYEFDAKQRIVQYGGQTIELTRREFDIAIYLFRNMDRLVPREHLEKMIWGRSIGPDSRALDTHMSRIRTKLNLCPRTGVRLMTIYSHGFRLMRVEAEQGTKDLCTGALPAHDGDGHP
jgi:DNA-binding response OmpR family regulator